jgi:DNA-binding MarR family transcriptional regulator
MTRMTTVGVDTPQMEAFRELMRAQDALSRVLDRELMDERALSLSEYVVLVALRYAPDGSLPVGALCTEVHLTRSGVTRLVDRMEAAGTVERIAAPGDRRTVRAAITKHGRDELRKAWPVHRRGIEDYFGAHLSDAEAETLRDLLRRIVSRPGSSNHPAARPL